MPVDGIGVIANYSMTFQRLFVSQVKIGSEQTTQKPRLMQWLKPLLRQQRKPKKTPRKLKTSRRPTSFSWRGTNRMRAYSKGFSQGQLLQHLLQYSRALKKLHYKLKSADFKMSCGAREAHQAMDQRSKEQSTGRC